MSVLIYLRNQVLQFYDERPPGVICTCNESTAIGGVVCAGQCEES
jgi:hypothetical protein